MRSVDRLEHQRRMKQKKNNQPSPDWETEQEMERPEIRFINSTKSVFDRAGIDGRDGINTAKSVFDRKAVFTVGETE